MAKNESLNRANKAKQDEFYTQLNDISRELAHYASHFRGAVVFCNCDDPETSNFWRYFELNFTFLGLKKLIATHYETDRPSYKLELLRDMNGDGKIDKLDIVKTPLKQNGDFRSPECVEILKEADIVVTNPPFSLFREYVAQLMEYEKKFLIIGNINAITYKEFFPLLAENKVWMGCSIHSGDREFQVPDTYPLTAAGFRIDEQGNKFIRVKGVRWFTNLDYKERHQELLLFRSYTPEAYPAYVNYSAIEVSKTADIPCDYDGEMGVPITFLDKYNPEQFEILGFSLTLAGLMSDFVEKGTYLPGGKRFYIAEQNGKYRYKRCYDRIVIKRKKG